MWTKQEGIKNLYKEDYLTVHADKIVENVPQFDPDLSLLLKEPSPDSTEEEESH